uniref:Uncharacterized protein n=1 Tax=Panagrolaimus sp. JU765 TaxID=591449 RepID=A0AC34QDU1_9BILA
MYSKIVNSVLLLMICGICVNAQKSVESSAEKSDGAQIRAMENALFKSMVGIVQGLLTQEKQELSRIFFNCNVPKNQIKKEILDWANKKSLNVSKEFLSILKDIATLESKKIDYCDKLIAGASAESKNIYAQFKQIIQNDNLSLGDECFKVSRLAQNLNKNTQKELRKILKEPPTCQLLRCSPIHRFRRQVFGGPIYPDYGIGPIGPADTVILEETHIIDYPY